MTKSFFFYKYQSSKIFDWKIKIITILLNICLNETSKEKIMLVLLWIGLSVPYIIGFLALLVKKIPLFTLSTTHKSKTEVNLIGNTISFSYFCSYHASVKKCNVKLKIKNGLSYLNFRSYTVIPYSVMQLDGNSFCRDVVFDNFKKASRDVETFLIKLI